MILMEKIKDFMEKILNKEQLRIEEIEYLAQEAVKIMILEPNIQQIYSSVIVVGDIHGQFEDLLHLFRLKGTPENINYVFLGDYVDRGPNSMETILLLLCYKILYPESLTLIRGNHEQRKINRIYGFYDEVIHKYKTPIVWNLLNKVFDYFLVGCVVNNRYLCVHGGISSRTTLSRMEIFDRTQEIDDEFIYNDILWSDPYNKPGLYMSPRGSGYLFGKDILKKFLMYNNLDLLIRSHQLAMEGYKWDHDDLCLTIWSAPNYMGQCTNPGCVLEINPGEEITSKKIFIFKK